MELTEEQIGRLPVLAFTSEHGTTGILLSEAVNQIGFAASASEALRAITHGSVSIEGRQVHEDLTITSDWFGESEHDRLVITVGRQDPLNFVVKLS